jgi:hypothetical protein
MEADASEEAMRSDASQEGMQSDPSQRPAEGASSQERAAAYESGPEDQTRPDLVADLRELGENLRETLRSAWASRERAQLQAEIEQGLKALGETVSRTVDEAAHELGDRQRVRERVAEVRTKVAGVREEFRPGHVADRTRTELHEVLTRVNAQLRRAQARWTPAAEGPGAGPEPVAGEPGRGLEGA